MYSPHTGAGVPAPAPRPGLSPAAAVLLWVFAGWPLSWILLFVFVPLGLAFGIGITIWMLVVACSGGGPRPVVVNVGTAPPPLPSPPSPAFARQLARRQEVEGFAVINAIGGCGWCGSPVAHVNDDGHPIHPRYWHAAEIEERIRSTMPPW